MNALAKFMKRIGGLVAVVWASLIVAAPADDGVNAAPTGILIEVPSPLTADDADRLAGTLNQINQSVATDSKQRATVVLRFPTATEDSEAKSATGQLEDALKLARRISGDRLKKLRCVAWLEGRIEGSRVLLVLACESMLVSRDASLADASSGGSPQDDTSRLIFESIAQRRGLLPSAVVASLTDPNLELARVTSSEAPPRFVSGKELDELRRSGEIVQEEVWSLPGEPLVLSANQLRTLRAAASIVDNQGDVVDHLGLSVLQNRSEQALDNPQAALIRVVGRISSPRLRRWQANLAASAQSDKTNVWLLEIDSPGGRLSGSASLAAVLADPGPTILRVGGYVSGEARGDAVLVALACRPLLLDPNATLGGSGADAFTSEDVGQQQELIQLIARQTGRSETLIRGILDPSVEVASYTNRKTGRIRYAVPSEIEQEEDAEQWKRGERIDFSEGIGLAKALQLGLADGQAEGLPDAASQLGLPGLPVELRDRGLVRMVERLGRNDALAFGLLLLGFMMLSAEMSAPGLGLPGFVAMICFAFFFWTKFLAGTAEWLELLAFGLGLVCIAIELLVLPGFGVFGLGGVILTVLGVVLMSQTFVIPRNAYQVEQLGYGLWMALAALVALIVGFVCVRAFLPQAATAAGLAMSVPEPELDEHERLAHYDHLLGQIGRSATPLRPSGKARFGDTLVAVVSDGVAIDKDAEVRVLQVHGNRVVVEAVDS